MKQKEARKQKAYKIPQSVYNKAMKRAVREKKNVANIVEGALYAYANGATWVDFIDIEECIHPVFLKEVNK